MSAVDHPHHYNNHPTGMECIELVERMGFCGGNAVKYLWRAGLKGSKREDLEKARWYVVRSDESDTARKSGDGLLNNHDLIEKACLGFAPLIGSAISHIIQEEYALALHAIDGLIATCPTPPDGKE